MGFPISSILAEIFLQHLDTNFYPKITRKNIQFIARYVDDIFIIYDANRTTAEDVLVDHNNMHSSFKYNLEFERDNIINFLDLKVHRKSKEFLIGVYRKLTFTYLTIPAELNHPMQHKSSPLHTCYTELIKYICLKMNILNN
jgi:hypothetical protein